MTRTARAYPADCDPGRVAKELDGLWSELTVLPELGERPGWAVLAREARRRAGWCDRFREQWSRLEVWARATDQPEAVREAIGEVRHRASQDALAEEARAVQLERRAAELAARGADGVVG